MKTRRVFVWSATITLLLGCATTGSRISENQALFDSYPPNVQSKIRSGTVDVGFDEDQVWMALGKPNEKSIETSAAGEVTVWAWTKSRPGVGFSVGGGSYGGHGVGGGVGISSGSKKDYTAVVRFSEGRVTSVRFFTD